MGTLFDVVARAREYMEQQWGTRREPASAAAVERADVWVRDRLGVPAPPELVELWLLVDGFGGNGVALYGPAEVVGTTELYVDDYPDHLMVGNHEDGPQFTWNRTNGQWETLEQGDFDYGPRATRSSFDELAEHCLRLLRGEDIQEAW